MDTRRRIKKCSKCKFELSLDYFTKKSSTKDGLDSQCRKCKKLDKINYNLNNKSKIALHKKEYYLQNKTKIANEAKSINGKFRQYKSNAKKRNIEFKLSKIEFINILTNKRCFYCGAIDELGIDRIDSNLGYTINNCTTCCKKCNIMKNVFSQFEFQEHIEKIFFYSTNLDIRIC